MCTRFLVVLVEFLTRTYSRLDGLGSLAGWMDWALWQAVVQTAATSYVSVNIYQIMVRSSLALETLLVKISLVGSLFMGYLLVGYSLVGFLFVSLCLFLSSCVLQTLFNRYADYRVTNSSLLLVLDFRFARACL